MRSFSPGATLLSREQGLWLVQRSCRQLTEQVLSLRQRHQVVRRDGGDEKTTQDVPAPLETSLQHCDHGEVESDS
jgi:hypothetical protein